MNTNKAKSSKDADLYSDEGDDDDGADDIMSPVAHPAPKKTKHSSAQESSASSTNSNKRPITSTSQSISNSIVNTAQIVAPNLASTVPSVQENITITDLIATMQTQQSQIEALTARVTQVNQGAGRDASRFIITGIDGTSKHMIDEIFGRNFIKWFLAVVKFRFTEQELIDNTLEPTTRSKRSHLAVETVALLRDALSFKYKFEPEKLDKAWAAVRQAVNNKGRNLRLRQKTRRLLAQVGRGVGGIVRNISNMSLGDTAA